MGTYSFGQITASTGSVVYVTGVAPGGCAFVTGSKAKGAFDVLTDVTETSYGFCEAYAFDNLSPIADGAGTALVCEDDNYIYSEDPCYGIVAWSPSTFIFKVSSYSTLPYVPTTCELQEPEYEWMDPNEYVCAGGSLIRGVKKDGKCRWSGATLLCDDCIPDYAPSGCDSILGEHPNSVAAPAPTPGSVSVPGDGTTGSSPGAPGPSPSSNKPGPSFDAVTVPGSGAASGSVVRHHGSVRNLFAAVLVAVCYFY